jgi:hypothetical protein
MIAAAINANREWFWYGPDAESKKGKLRKLQAGSKF